MIAISQEWIVSFPRKSKREPFK